MSSLDVNGFKYVCPNADISYLPYFQATCAKFGITSKLSMAAFLATIAYESGQFVHWREIDGSRMWYAPYYGRGPMQLTHLSNYANFGGYLGIDLVNNPDLVASNIQIGFDAAGWFWRYGNGDLNIFAEEGDFWTCYIRVLGGDNGSYDARYAYYERALEVIGGTDMVSVEDFMAAMEEVIGASYRWWDGAYPFTPGAAMYADGSGHCNEDGWAGKYDKAYVMREGINCTGLLNRARMECGLAPIGGTGHWADWIWANGGQTFSADTPGQRGAICVHKFEDGISEGHIAVYWDDEYLIQSESSGGVHRNEHHTTSHAWAQYEVYGLMPDVDYTNSQIPTDKPNWKKDGWIEIAGIFKKEDSGLAPSQMWGAITESGGKKWLEIRSDG